MKEQYWQNDTQKNTPAALNQLIRDASTLDLSVYVLKYTSITKALIANNEMSTMQRCRRFLDGLSEHLRDKAFDFCTTNDWKLSSHDTGSKDPDYDKLKKFILDKALAAKKRIVYIKERATEGYDELKESVTSVVATPPAPAVSLQDQFDATPQPGTVSWAERFLPPVQKTHNGVYPRNNPSEHLVMYRLNMPAGVMLIERESRSAGSA